MSDDEGKPLRVTITVDCSDGSFARIDSKLRGRADYHLIVGFLVGFCEKIAPGVQTVKRGDPAWPRRPRKRRRR